MNEVKDWAQRKENSGIGLYKAGPSKMMTLAGFSLIKLKEGALEDIFSSLKVKQGNFLLSKRPIILRSLFHMQGGITNVSALPKTGMLLAMT